MDMKVSASETSMRWCCGDCLSHIKMLMSYNHFFVVLNLYPEALQGYFVLQMMPSCKCSFWHCAEVDNISQILICSNMLGIIARCACVHRVVDLVARSELQPGDAVTLDYGSRPMRDLLRNYCFMPSDAAEQLPHEVHWRHSLYAL